jgi:hypothetical protein
LILSICYLVSIHFASPSGENIAFAMHFVFILPQRMNIFSCNKNINIQLKARLVVEREHCLVAAFKNQMVN